MANRPYRTSVSGIALALGLAATPLSAQETDAAAELLAAYPGLADIGDQSCLATLADYGAGEGEGALDAFLRGEATADSLPDADADVVACALAAEQALAADSPAQAAEEPAAAPEDTAEAGAEGEAEPADAAPDDQAAAGAEPAEGLPAEEAVPDPDAAAAPDAADAPIDEEAMAADPAPAESETETATEAVADTGTEAEAAAPAAEDSESEAAAAPSDAGAEAEIGAQAEAETEAPTPAEAVETEATASTEPDGDDDALRQALEAQEAAADEEGAAVEAAEAPSDEAETAEAAPAPAAEPDDGEAALRQALETEQADGAVPAAEGDAMAGEAATAEAEAVPDEGAEEAASATALEAVQEDTEAATEAANEPVTVQAAAAEDSATAEAQSEEVETVVVTEEAARTSDEEFEEPTAEEQAAADDDEDGIRFGQVAAGVLGGVILNEILGANEEVVANTGDRVVVQRGDGDYYVLKDETALLRQPGTEVMTQRFSDGSVRETVARQDGTQVVTIRAPNGQLVRRERILSDGRRIVLFDDTQRMQPVDLRTLPEAAPEFVEFREDMDAEALRRALAREEARLGDRRFSLRQVRDIRAVRNLVPTLQLETVTFETGSAAIRPSEAEELSMIGRTMRRMIEENPYEVFLIEGHTDAVGPAAFNLALSDRRAESVALALTEYFGVPPENMVVQGYGESNLRIPTAGPERENRRAAVRRITPLLNIARAR